jgi:hypothetical protein
MEYLALVLFSMTLLAKVEEVPLEVEHLAENDKLHHVI